MQIIHTPGERGGRPESWSIRVGMACIGPYYRPVEAAEAFLRLQRSEMTTERRAERLWSVRIDGRLVGRCEDEREASSLLEAIVSLPLEVIVEPRVSRQVRARWWVRVGSGRIGPFSNHNLALVAFAGILERSIAVEVDPVSLGTGDERWVLLVGGAEAGIFRNVAEVSDAVLERLTNADRPNAEPPEGDAPPSP